MHKIHDKFFGAAISHIQVARELFQQFLPVHIQECIDFESLGLWQGKVARADLSRSEVDVVYQGKLKSAEPCYCYAHVEQQSDPERHLPVRLLAYKCDILLQHIKQYPDKPLPPIFCIVIYNGKRPYPYPTNLLDMFAESVMAEETLFKPVTLIDLPKTPDTDLVKHAWSGSMLGLFKHMRCGNIPDYIRDQLCSLLNRIEKEDGMLYISTITNYILKGSSIADEETFRQMIHGAVSPDTEEKMMTLAENIMKKGRQEGRQEEKMYIAKKLLTEGTDPVFVAKVTNLQLSTIRDLQRLFVDGESV